MGDAEQPSFRWRKKLYNMVGNKFNQLQIIVPIIARHILQTKGKASCDYVEPFCGSGVVFTNLLMYLLETKRVGKTSKVSAKLNLNMKISDANPFIIDFWNTVLNRSDIELMLKWIKKLVKRYMNGKTEQQKNKIYNDMREEFNSNAVRLSKPVVRAAYFVVLMKLCYGSYPRFNKQGLFNNPPGHRKVESVNNIIDVNALMNIHELLTDRKLHESVGVKLNITFTWSDVRSTVKRVVPTSSATTFVVYMDPPYTDSAELYGKNEEITAETDWSVMYLVESCKKQKRKTPNILVSNCDGYYNRYCKYRLQIRIKNKQNTHHRQRIEVLVSNKSLGPEKVVDCE